MRFDTEWHFLCAFQFSFFELKRKKMHQEFPTIISYYTLKTLYQREVENLIASTARYGLKTSIEGIPCQGSWELNCAYKPFFILKMLEAQRAPVLWVDADAVFARAPEILPEFEADLVTYIEKDVEERHPSKVRTGTVYVNYTSKGIELVQRWASECQRLLLDPARTEEFWDQVALRNVLTEDVADLRSLPLEYVKIFDHPQDSRLAPNPVITHYQASRRFKSSLFSL